MSYSKPMLIALMGMLFMVGCGGPQTPPMRMGSLPYPSPFYATADPENLGPHRYGGWSLRESGRGIIYSEHGGFIDLAHIRITADWAWYYYQRIHRALERGDEQLGLAMNKGSRMRLYFEYPEHWDEVADERRPELIHEISLGISKDLVWILGAWHEIATWYGYSRFVIGSERISAFTYDDTFSHLVGMRVVGRAIDGPDVDYNEAMTKSLELEMRKLGALSPEQTRAATERVRGRWWGRGGSKRRYVELSLNGEPQRPWLAPDEPGEPGRLGEAFELPGLGVIDGYDYSDFYRVEIQPRILEAGKIRRAAGMDSGSAIDPAVHFEPIMADIRAELLEEYGPQADRP